MHYDSNFGIPRLGPDLEAYGSDEPLKQKSFALGRHYAVAGAT